MKLIIQKLKKNVLSYWKNNSFKEVYYILVIDQMILNISNLDYDKFKRENLQILIFIQ